MLTVLWVEWLNLLILLQSKLVFNVITDFLALVVIVEFDNYFASTLKTDRIFTKFIKNKEYAENEPHALRIETTTSNNALLNS